MELNSTLVFVGKDWTVIRKTAWERAGYSYTAMETPSTRRSASTAFSMINPSKIWVPERPIM